MLKYLCLPTYVNEKYDHVPRKIVVSKNRYGRITIECDEIMVICWQKEPKTMDMVGDF